jgi:hypothetical protein
VRDYTRAGKYRTYVLARKRRQKRAQRGIMQHVSDIERIRFLEKGKEKRKQRKRRKR